MVALQLLAKRSLARSCLAKPTLTERTVFPTILFVLMPIRPLPTATTQHVKPVYYSQEELVNARRGEKEAAERLEEASFRCTKAEESLAQARGERVSFESALRDMERARDAQAKELPDRASESHHVASQTSVAYRQYCDLEQTLLRSQGDLQQARVDLTSSKKKTAELEQQLEGSIAERHEAMQEARRNSELASARKEEILSISKREQVSTTNTLEAQTNMCPRVDLSHNTAAFISDLACGTERSLEGNTRFPVETQQSEHV